MVLSHYTLFTIVILYYFPFFFLQMYPMHQVNQHPLTCLRPLWPWPGHPHHLMVEAPSQATQWRWKISSAPVGQRPPGNWSQRPPLFCLIWRRKRSTSSEWLQRTRLAKANQAQSFKWLPSIHLVSDEICFVGFFIRTTVRMVKTIDVIMLQFRHEMCM